METMLYKKGIKICKNKQEENFLRKQALQQLLYQYYRYCQLAVVCVQAGMLKEKAPVG